MRHEQDLGKEASNEGWGQWIGAGVAIWGAVRLGDDCASRISYTTNV